MDGLDNNNNITPEQHDGQFFGSQNPNYMPNNSPYLGQQSIQTPNPYMGQQSSASPDQYMGQQSSASPDQYMGQQNPNRFMGNQQQFSAQPSMNSFSPQQALYRQNDYSPQSGLQYQGSYPGQNSFPTQQNIPQDPAPQNKKHTIQIIILIAAFVLISLCVISVFLNWGPFRQSGGRETVSDLMNDYISAVNKADVEEYLKLVPKAERTDEERKAVEKAFSKLEYTDGDMSISVGASKNYSDSNKQLVKDKLNSMSFMPVRVDSVQEVNATITGEDYEQHVIFTVVESNGKFFIDDVTEK